MREAIWTAKLFLQDGRDALAVTSRNGSCRGSELGFHIERLSTTCNSSSRGSDTLFWILEAPALTCTYPMACIYTCCQKQKREEEKGKGGRQGGRFLGELRYK